ncbi:MAG TPA: ATP-dependent helicase [Xanthobacteraceae bacterium]|jgi:DNA helicase-2/ATP-dependent DNA helicase PcrA
MTADSLDAAQKAAATATGAHQLVLAGPGSGKTTTLTGRFVHLMRQGVDRKRILALTFTKKAADEMKGRIGQALDLASTSDLTVATFHGFAFRQLRRNPQLAGLPEHFQLWDAPQQRHVFNSRKMWWNEETDILDIIMGAKERLLSAERFAAEIDPGDEVLASAVAFFRVYEDALQTAGAIDFADMVPLLVRAIDDHPGYGALLTGAYAHLLVDEFQDVNPGQVELIDRFVRAGVALWAVGDDDQTLYAFRAADVRFILDFPQKYRSAQVHILDRNYRSAPGIVEAAKRLIVHTRARRHKDYHATTTEPGEIVIRGYASPEIEARQVAKAVAQLLEQYRPEQLAVLYRVGSVGLALQPALQQLEIPYEVRGAGDLWQGVAARLVVGSLYYLREGESVDAMSRMGSSRRAQIVRRRLDETRRGKKLSFATACQMVRDVVVSAVPGQASDRTRAEWASIVEAVIAVASSCSSLRELETKILEQSATLRDPPEHAVVLSTIHSAKGLEWEAVLMVGMEEGVLPHASNEDLEEERRVAYVGVTRAKRILGLTYASLRFGQASGPSRFLRELAGPERRNCIWTGPRADAAEERLPLLSSRERQRLRARVSAQGKEKQAPAHRKDGLPARHGQAWSSEEDSQLVATFRQGVAIADIAITHQRKRGAITSRLIRLGLIEETADARS